jgi:hypothetical protein
MKGVLSTTTALIFCLGMTSLAAQDSTTQAAAAPVVETTPAEPAAAVETPATAPAATQLPKEITDKIGTPEAGKALVVFFRPKKFVGAAIGFKVRENDVELGKLRNGNFFVLQVEPGKHSYVVHSEVKDVTPIEAEEGETYFMMGELNMGVLAGRPNLTPSTAVNFQSEISKLKPSKPLD